MDKDHCAKCIHLRRNRKWKERPDGSIYAEGFLPGFYHCMYKWWSERPNRDFGICEHFAKNKTGTDNRNRRRKTGADPATGTRDTHATLDGNP